MNRPHDMNGIPIYAGDVLRTFHYRDRQHSGRKMYLYHAVVENGDNLEAVPVHELATKKKDGGRFWLFDSTARGSEIVQGYGPEQGQEFTDRPKKLENK